MRTLFVSSMTGMHKTRWLRSRAHLPKHTFSGGQAAHAFGPGSYTISGNVHLDDDENWTLSVDPKDGINLLAVAIHEIGKHCFLTLYQPIQILDWPKLKAFVDDKLNVSTNMEVV